MLKCIAGCQPVGNQCQLLECRPPTPISNGMVQPSNVRGKAELIKASLQLGMGVYSTPGVVLESVGSIGMAFVLWLIGALVAFCECPHAHVTAAVSSHHGHNILTVFLRCKKAGLNLYIELASRFPRRSGGDAVFLVERTKEHTNTLVIPRVTDVSQNFLGTSVPAASIHGRHLLCCLCSDAWLDCDQCDRYSLTEMAYHLAV